MRMTDWKTTKSTTDKLEGHLFELDDLGYEPHTIAFVGGRDWVIIAFKDVPAPPNNSTQRGD